MTDLQKEVRPTSGLVVQALFNILGKPSGRSFLDLFAGSGRVGEEAMIRGFSPVVFVELSSRRSNNISSRIKESGQEVLRMDVRRALVVLASRASRFNIVFADPPYSNGWVERMASLSGRLSAIMSDSGLFVLEHTKREALESSLWSGWEVESKAYGETVLSFFKKMPQERVSLFD